MGEECHHEGCMDINMFSIFSKFFWWDLFKVLGGMTDLFRNRREEIWPGCRLFIWSEFLADIPMVVKDVGQCECIEAE
jgi:hypothetical protein